MKVYYGLILLLFFTTACRKETTWNSDWVVPIINDTLDLSNLVNDSTLSIDAGNYVVNLNRTLLDIKVADFVSIPDTTIEQSFTLAVPSINVPPGTQFVNSIEEHVLQLQDLELKRILLKEGEIKLVLKNPVEADVKMVIELSGVSKNGVTLVETYIAPPANGSTPGILEKSLNLAGYSIDLTGISGNDFNFLQSKVTVSTLPTAGTVVVTNQDVTYVDATIKNMVLDYARGYFGSRIIQDTTDFNIDFFQNIAGGSIDLPETSINVKIENSIKFDARGKIDYLKNENFAASTVFLTGGEMGNTFLLDQPTGSFNSLAPTFVELLFNSGNSSVEQYFENLGIRHQLAYELQINPWGNTSGGWNEIYPTSRIKLSVEATMPLSLQTNDLTIRDTFEFSLEQSKDKSHISSGSFVLDADNGFPFAGAIKLLLLDENNQLVATVVGTQPIYSSLQGTPNAQGVLHKLSQLEFIVTEEIIDQLDQIKFIAVESIFNTPDPSTSFNQMVAIPADGFLGIKLKAMFNFKAIVK